MTLLNHIANKVSGASFLSENDALSLESEKDTRGIMALAAAVRDQGFGHDITYSRKIFIPLTQLCRDVCHYCTFAQAPKRVTQPYLPLEEVVELARAGKDLGCKEALFTLGEKPELRYASARKALSALGYASTLHYLRDAAEAVFRETGLLPHMNPGTMTTEECAMLREVSPSMGIMLESAAERLCQKGGVHYGSPDKVPSVRLKTLRVAGELRVPFTSGILIGIGETRRERIEALLALRALHEEFGHIQEIIVQNFRAKPGTKMHAAPEPDLDDMLWTLAVARLVFGPQMSIQAPPNLSPGALVPLVDAGINDWGGVSPLTPDHVNPEAPWPHLEKLADESLAAGKFLHERLTIYPAYVRDLPTWVAPTLHTALLQMTDAEGYPRTDGWSPGETCPPPPEVLRLLEKPEPLRISPDIRQILEHVDDGQLLADDEIARLFRARGEDFTAVCRAADRLRRAVNGDTVSYVVNRNINYTNVCYFKCQFCAFSKGKLSENLRGAPYDLDDAEIKRRVGEAWERGATEVCMQGGIHPQYTGDTYLHILDLVKEAVPQIHIHAFSPLEVWQGAATSGLSLADYLARLREGGLGTLPGTAAEVLDDEVRAVLCPDKLTTEQWLEVMRTAHGAGFKTTATIMYGHVDRPIHWARHLRRIRDLQIETGGFTEFVPLPFVHMEAPLYLKGRARRGPTFREAVLMHAVSRLALHPHIRNIQTSWVKMGRDGVVVCLNAGANDLGGTLMNESITRAAGAEHGQETSPAQMMALIAAAGRDPKQRTTAYDVVDEERIRAGANADALSSVVNTPARKYERRERRPLVRSSITNAEAG